MIGPKLDARSYAVLILVIMALAVSGTLVAQQFGTTSARSSADATAEVADANRQIAEALREIAKSNSEIATSIDRLSRSVGDIKEAIGRQAGQQQPGASGGAAATRPDTGIEPDRTPVFEMRR